ncbi:hypothetical protein P9112_006122 [Eukaryota sp. TZLM1-RC]
MKKDNEALINTQKTLENTRKQLVIYKSEAESLKTEFSNGNQHLRAAQAHQNLLKERNEGLSYELQTARDIPYFHFNVLPITFTSALYDQAREVNLTSYKLDETCVSIIAGFLKENQHIIEMNLTNNYINGRAALLIAQSLKINCSLEFLDLGVNKIPNYACKALADALVINCTLRRLGLSGNLIRYQGARDLAQALERNSSLVNLHLDRNNCGNKGAIFLSRALKINNTLELLSLQDNNIDDEGAEALAEAMMVNSRVKLRLNGNKLTEEKKREFKERFGDRIHLVYFVR